MAVGELDAAQPGQVVSQVTDRTIYDDPRGVLLRSS